MRNTLIFFLVVIFNHCSPNNGEKDQNTGKLNHTPERNPVDVMILKETDFSKELVSNGKVLAVKKCILRFRISECLEYLLN